MRSIVWSNGTYQYRRDPKTPGAWPWFTANGDGTWTQLCGYYPPAAVVQQMAEHFYSMAITGRRPTEQVVAS
jgi:hypothetical protein